jgi:probable addiction module antidote protein
MELRRRIPFDAARYIPEPEAMAELMRLAFVRGDIAEIVEYLGIVARAEGMTEIARRTGLSRESLYRSLTRGGNPELTTVLRVLDALDLRLSVVHKVKVEPAKRRRGSGPEKGVVASRPRRPAAKAGAPARKAARKATVRQAASARSERVPGTRAAPARKPRGKASKAPSTRHR